ncbi:MAG: ABC transporter ATP-binding protein [Geminicoccaceae bacterium]|nr:ABC transporter ATP-binding protein [Geminicoccaceae bacterium]MCX7629722.1 ABC transporter ATP-binding protein [Geminicoccaceae bacterium]MDW8369042.1 ABC transporter ATP-binding protein [Geminicoccaceae bacterium]
MTAVLLARGLAKSFGAVVAAADLDLELRANEIHAVIGPNGAGKTTLLGLLAGELRPDAGRIVLAGRDITPLPVHARAALGLGRTFQVSSVLPSFTVLENVAIAVQARAGSSFRFLRAAETDESLNGPARSSLDKVGLGALADRPASTLAHGERRLLELAMALVQRPRVLLLDEPLAGVAPAEAEQLLALLESLRSEMGILLVEHDMDAVFRLADRVTVLVHGRVIASGAPAEVRRDPAVRSAYLGEDDEGAFDDRTDQLRVTGRASFRR